jgi:hypothetical protein
MQGPGLAEAVRAAAALRARLPAERGMALLRHAESAVRAEACRCVPRHPLVVAISVDLLEDLHPAVATAGFRSICLRTFTPPWPRQPPAPCWWCSIPSAG